MVPKAVKSVLWSYDTKKLDMEKHKKVIVSHVLNFGTKKATDWLFEKYGKKNVAKIANTIPKGQWDKKSLALWTLLLGIRPVNKNIK